MIDIDAIKARLMHRPVNDEPHYCPETRSYIYTPVVPASEDLAALIGEVERLQGTLDACLAEYNTLAEESDRLRPYELAYDPDALIEAKAEIALLQEHRAEQSAEIKRLWRIIDGPR